MKPRILVTRKLPDDVETRLASSFDVRFNPSDTPLSATDLAAAMLEFDALVPTVSDGLDAGILRTPESRARMIANVGVGFSNIDIETARHQDIAVSNTPDVLTEATADVAFLLVLSATRRAYMHECTLRENRWEGFSLVEGLGMSLQGKTLEIVGMGRIGQATARRAVQGFGMKCVFYNRSTVTVLNFEAMQRQSIEAVMAEADVLSVHAAGDGSNPIINAGHIAKMKPTSYLVNTARGNRVDQSALIMALKEGRIAGAGFNVYEKEPEVPEALRQLDNVTLLPHIGSATHDVRTAMGMLAVDNLDAFFSGKPIPNNVV